MMQVSDLYQCPNSRAFISTKYIKPLVKKAIRINALIVGLSFLQYPFTNPYFMRVPEIIFAYNYQNILTLTILGLFFWLGSLLLKFYLFFLYQSIIFYIHVVVSQIYTLNLTARITSFLYFGINTI